MSGSRIINSFLTGWKPITCSSAPIRNAVHRHFRSIAITSTALIMLSSSESKSICNSNSTSKSKQSAQKSTERPSYYHDVSTYLITISKLYYLNWLFCHISIIVLRFNHCSILSKCYIKNLKLFLNLDIHNNDDLSTQLSVLNHFNILPLKLRFFTHYCTFLHSLFFNQVCSPLINLFIKPKYSLALRTPFLLPNYTKKCGGLNSLLFMGTKFLNSFVYSYVSTPKKAFNEYLSSNCVYYFNMHKNAF